MQLPFRLTTELRLEEWQQYLKGTLGNVLKVLRREVGQNHPILLAPKMIELVAQFSTLIEQVLSFHSPEEGRFLPKFPRYLFFDVAADGALKVIIIEVYRFFTERQAGELTLANLVPEDFKQLYQSVFSALLDGGFIEVPRFYLDVPEEQKADLQGRIEKLHGKEVFTPEDATCVIRPLSPNIFCPSIPDDFVRYKQRPIPGLTIDLAKAATISEYLLRVVEPPEGSKKQGNTLVHIRCLPCDYDITMHSRSLQAIRSSQTGSSAVASLIVDEFSPAVFYRPRAASDTLTVGEDDLEARPLVVPPQYIMDSCFFNEWLNPYDYVNSVQESKINKVQLGEAAEPLRPVRSNPSKAGSSLPIGRETAPPLSQSTYTRVQAAPPVQEPPCAPHQSKYSSRVVNPHLRRGFETGIRNGLVHTNPAIVAGSDVSGGTPATPLQTYGLFLAGVPVCTSISPLFSDELKSRMVGRPRREDFNVNTLMLTAKMRKFIELGDASSSLLNLYVKYNQSKRSTVTITLQELCATMRGHPLPFIFQIRRDPLLMEFRLGQHAISLLEQPCPSLPSGTHTLHAITGQTLRLQAVPTVPLLEDIRVTLQTDLYHTPIAQHACHELLPRAVSQVSCNVISADEQAHFSGIPGFDWTSYLTLRNTLLSAWRYAPHIYLSLDACTRTLPYCAVYITQVYDYLTARLWINHPAYVVAATVPPFSLRVRDPLEQYVEQANAKYPRLQAGTCLCGLCRTQVSRVRVKAGSTGPGARLNLPRVVCEACYARDIIPRLEKIHASYVLLDANSARMTDVPGWTDVQCLVLLDCVKTALGDNVSFFDVFDFAARAMKRPAEECLKVYTSLTRREAGPDQPIVEEHVRKLTQQFVDAGEGDVLAALQGQHGCDAALAVYVATLARARVLATVEEARITYDLYGALEQ
ncbi:SWIRM domain-containing protein [Giardia muris]|uniref:SWIRM domain-containing protein n=1 Tax=Giardia muris TaxID=5742 RepID=A0A4Z1T0J7_GIAMU|nr:SWIRM domain-containing protein [Giardia muris]|eukprot:TNJ26437.1 SWIRM domain-containing protein [Giardia muris]